MQNSAEQCRIVQRGASVRCWWFVVGRLLPPERMWIGRKRGLGAYTDWARCGLNLRCGLNQKKTKVPTQ
eukprot:8835936-Alexandrium_andersonii.AAC.1